MNIPANMRSFFALRILFGNIKKIANEPIINLIIIKREGEIKSTDTFCRGKVSPHIIVVISSSLKYFIFIPS
jgi:hypothetical protein